MVHALRSRECWAATRVDLASTLSSHIHLEERASRTLELLARQLGCHLGAIHVLERDSGRLKAVAAYAAADSDVESPVPGEGLLGQAFASSECLVIRDVPEDTRFVVKLGFGQAIPKTILALPLAVGQETFGVLSLASLHRLSEEEIEFVMEARIPIAVGINNAIVHRQIGLLAQELREKNAELEARNSELQAQAEEISAQNEEIRAQAEEIAVQNEELETQRNELVERNEELGRMRAREEMERRKLEILMGSLPEGIVICDGEGSITATNRVAEKLFARPVPYGASSDAYIRELRLYRPDGEMYRSQEFPLVRAAREGVIFNGVEVVVRRSDGREKLLLCNAAPLRDSAGVPMGAVGVFQDITSFKSNLIASKLPEYQDRPL
jgi:PAS domain-containing protein